MADIQRQNYGRMAQPALIALMVGLLTWQVLSLAGNDLVTNQADVGNRTSVAVLAVLKESRHWVAVALGGLVYLWAWQMKKMEGPAVDERTFIAWSAELPQWKPRVADSETAVFLVPAPPVPTASPEASRPQTRSIFEQEAPEPALVRQLAPAPPSTGRFRDMEHLAERFMAARFRQPGASAMGLARMPAGGLVKVASAPLPANLPLEKIARLPRTEFERLAGEYFRNQGYDVAALGSIEGTECIDLILQRPNEIIVVKCAPGESVDVPMEPVRELLAMVMAEGATKGILLTAGQFSRKAVKFAHQKGRNRLELISGRQFESMLRSASAGSPACPCCGGAMVMAPQRKRFRRRDLAWTCQKAPQCRGQIRAGDLMKNRSTRQQRPALALR